MWIGIDDTDSLKGMCTTYLASILARRLKIGGYPRLIRLNPNIPFKTRGNGAVALKIENNNQKAKKTTLQLVELYSQFDDPKTNPGVVFLEDESKETQEILKRFYLKAVSELVSIEEAEEIAVKNGIEYAKFKNGRGIIGALAAIGATLMDDKTYEFLAYRKPENYGKRRKIDADSVLKMNESTYPKTFDNINPESNRIIITPRGHDPIFCGIRGENPGILQEAWDMIKPLEYIQFTQIFESNQATDAHLRHKKIKEVNPYDCVILEGVVVENPKTIEGGHVIVKIKDDSGETDCAAYKPTQRFRDYVRALVSGDRVSVYGGVGKYPSTVNMEKIRVLSLKAVYEREVPLCCSRRMTSAGKNKGFKCRKCGRKTFDFAERETKRSLTERIYEVPPTARRHLSKPLVRFYHAGFPFQ